MSYSDPSNKLLDFSIKELLQNKLYPSALSVFRTEENVCLLLRVNVFKTALLDLSYYLKSFPSEFSINFLDNYANKNLDKIEQFNPNGTLTKKQYYEGHIEAIMRTALLENISEKQILANRSNGRNLIIINSLESLSKILKIGNFQLIKYLKKVAIDCGLNIVAFTNFNCLLNQEGLYAYVDNNFVVHSQSGYLRKKAVYATVEIHSEHDKIEYILSGLNNDLIK